MIVQGARKRAYAAKEGNSPRLKQKRSNNKLIKYERFKKKQIHHYNIIPSDLPKWVFLEQTEMVFGEMKNISQWKRCYEHNGIAPIGQKCTKNLEP